ncbi:putative enzyme related to lactoylglutathione lyase [Amorphus suaedae]
MSMSQGDFCWYELMTSDPKAAVAFYTTTIGWEATDSGMPGMDYTLLGVGPHRIAGVMSIPERAAQSGAQPAWMGYIAVADVDAMADTFAKAGGAIHHAPEDIPGIGRFAVVGDPQGAVICLFRGDGAPPPSLPAGSAGTFGWHELLTDDPEAAFAFYASHFGWEKMEAMDMGDMGVYQIFGKAGTMVGAMMRRPPQVPVCAWGYYINVEAIDAAIERLKTAGGQVVNGPMEVPGGMWIVQGFDPQGAYFAMVAPKK